MRHQFRNLDTWRGRFTAAWVCLAPPTAMVVVFVAGGVTTNTFIVDAHALGQTRQDSVFDELAKNVPEQPGVDGSIGTEARSTVEVPVTGAIDGTTTPTPGGVGDPTGIPAPVLAAYQKAATDLAAAKPGCKITWPLLAGIGKVESDHAKGGKVDANGVTRGKILGPVLDGGPGMAAISDTDQGAYDGNTTWDRAVGPMQFIPGTWKAFGADGNGDGVKDPHNVFDAARSAGEYLCSGGSDLSDPQGLVQAVLRYNHSMDYVSTVLRWMQQYGKSTVTIPGQDGVIDPPDDDGNDGDNRVDTTPPPTTTTTTTPPAPPRTSPTPTVHPSLTPKPSTKPTPKPPTTKPTSKPPTTRPTSKPPTTKPPYSPTPTFPTRTPTPTPTKTPGCETPTPTPTPTPTGSPTVTPTPTPTPTPSPTCTPAGEPSKQPSEGRPTPQEAPKPGS